jgi:hypothetical protein
MASSPSKRRATHWLVAAIVLLVAAPATAATITVASTADVSVVACTLRDAITAANTDAPSGACLAGACPRRPSHRDPARDRAARGQQQHADTRPRRRGPHAPSIQNWPMEPQ